jgi:hypothetical protein
VSISCAPRLSSATCSSMLIIVIARQISVQRHVYANRRHGCGPCHIEKPYALTRAASAGTLSFSFLPVSVVDAPQLQIRNPGTFPLEGALAAARRLRSSCLGLAARWPADRPRSIASG